jgi:CRISPR-associated exonuclease Cas4
MPILFFAFILLALVLFWIAGQQREASGLPGGRIISSDTAKWQPVEKPLYAPNLGLTGKPDYLIQQGQLLIPVEVKTSQSPPRAPYDSHIFQLAAYCLLVHEVYHVRPTHGILHYSTSQGKSQTYHIEFSPELEMEARATIEQIQAQPMRGGVDRSHNLPARCARCGYRTSCDQALRERL